MTAWHDNTSAKKSNPDPNQWVGWGDRTVDEMAHAWINIVYMKDDDFKIEQDKRRATRATTALPVSAPRSRSDDVERKAARPLRSQTMARLVPFQRIYGRLAAQRLRQRLHEFADGRDLAVLRNELEG